MSLEQCPQPPDPSPSELPTVSVCLPSLFPDLLDACLTALFARSPGMRLEVLVVSPFEVRDPRVVWIREDSPAGNCAAHQLAFQAATGDLVVSLSDDFHVLDGCLEAAVRFLLERERLYFPYACGLAELGGGIGTAYGIYYPYFPLMRRTTVAFVGGWFDPHFRSHFGDIDLALRVWAQGGRCELSPGLVWRLPDRQALPESAHKYATAQADLETFTSRWGPLFGLGWGSGLRDFNLDVIAPLVPTLLDNHTVFLNDPQFAETLRQTYDLMRYDYQKWG